ncbi:MAG TPA: hypothetical protein VMW28_05700 [Pelolinea sp.]|nr:hypothetical protein [Pelolinea sp.]
MKEEKKTLLEQAVIAINLGLNQFALSLEEQGVDVAHVHWTPPADGDEEMLDLLDKLL